MFHIEITGGAPGRPDLMHAYDDRAVAERIAAAILGYLERNQLPDYRQGVQVVDDQGRWIWRRSVGADVERLN